MAHSEEMEEFLRSQELSWAGSKSQLCQRIAAYCNGRKMPKNLKRPRKDAEPVEEVKAGKQPKAGKSSKTSTPPAKKARKQ